MVGSCSLSSVAIPSYALLVRRSVLNPIPPLTFAGHTLIPMFPGGAMFLPPLLSGPVELTFVAGLLCISPFGAKHSLSGRGWCVGVGEGYQRPSPDSRRDYPPGGKQ